MNRQKETEIIRRLFNTGYFRAGSGNPLPHEAEHIHHAASWEVTRKDLPYLRLVDPVVKEAIAAHQAVFKDELNAAAETDYARAIQVDGEAGPLTQHHILGPDDADAFDPRRFPPRCDCPDFDVDDDDILRAKWNRAEANWPDHCRERLKFGRDFLELPGLTETDTNEVWWAACNNWTAAVADIVMDALEAGERDGADIWATLRRLSGSVLAWSQLARNRCDVELAQAYDRRTWGKGQAAATATHEVGHALGLNHITGPRTVHHEATMFPSITSATIRRRGWPNEADRAQAARLGYSVGSNPEQPQGDDLWKPRGEPGPKPGPDLGGLVQLARTEAGQLELRMLINEPPDLFHGDTHEWILSRLKQ